MIIIIKIKSFKFLLQFQCYKCIACIAYSEHKLYIKKVGDCFSSNFL